MGKPACWPCGAPAAAVAMGASSIQMPLEMLMIDRKPSGAVKLVWIFCVCMTLLPPVAIAQKSKQENAAHSTGSGGGSSHAVEIDMKDLPNQPLTMEQAVDYGLTHNRNLKSYQEEAMAVSQKVKQAQAGFLPKLDAKYSFTQIKDRPYVNLAIPGFPSEGVQTNITTANHWELDVTQPLFTGFNLTAQLNIARMGYKVAQCSLESARLDLIRNIKHVFLQVLLGEKLVEVARDNVKALEMQRQNAEDYYHQGLTAKNDMLKAEVALAEAVQTERAAVKQLTVIRSKLNQLLDLDIQSKISLQDKKTTIEQLPQLDALYRKAERQRPELIALDTSILQADEGIRAAQSGYYPIVSAFGQYYREGQDFFGQDNPYTNEQNASVGVKIAWNWFEGGKTEATARENKYRKRSLQEQRRDLEKQIKIQVEDAYEQLNVARANIQTTETALAQARENERMTTLQYGEQLVIFLEVLNARVFTLQSSVNYYQALYGYQMALADLERAIGDRMIADNLK